MLEKSVRLVGGRFGSMRIRLFPDTLTAKVIALFWRDHGPDCAVIVAGVVIVVSELSLSETPSVFPPTRGALFTLYLAVLVTGMAQALVFVLIPLIGRELKLHELVLELPVLAWRWQPRELAITALTALTSMVFSLAAPWWGRLSDRWGRRRVLIVGMLGYSGGTLLFNGVAEAAGAGLLGGAFLYGALALARMAYASLMAGSAPASAAYIADVTNAAQRAAGIGRLNAATQIGALLGPMITACAAISLLAPMYVYAALSALAALLVWRWLPESGARVAREQAQAHLRFWDRRYRRLLLIGFAMCAVMGMAQSTLVFYFQDVLRLDTLAAASRFSGAMMVSAAAMVFAQLVLAQRCGWSSMRLLQIGLPLALLSYLLLASAASLPQLWAAMAAFGLGMGLCLPGFGASASLTVGSTEQGAMAGIVSATIGWGFLAGPLLGGFIYAQNHSLTYWCAAAVMVLLTVVAWRERA